MSAENEEAGAETPEPFVIAPPPAVTVPVRGGGLFPVHRVYCIGRNYADHAIEMGHDPSREPPFFFQKNPDNLLFGADFPYPPMSSDVHFEIELVVALGRGGVNIAEDEALEHVWGYAVGLDMTRRDLQGEAKKMGRPWEIGKAFEHSAPIGPIESVFETGHPECGVIALDVNGTRRQEGDLAQMIWKVPEMIAYLSRFFVLAPGDLIFTGTPAGVGPVQRGDQLHASVEGVGEIDIAVI
ncbi:fumarylacetoacetate hydrolase family protein [Limibaculum sp. M0105]|uniref:Fumarylacetoacetate hydrolase family protein n=1 Tax=Thermohalobaculum xanthum TaxID=2753746 RepID=A0A8J7M8M7_9RHOB|nr:fumarylacetoacetate hydrolase family protein [Thermohalobaculum xanthum]MBK0400240.1 fumarylacetoacetate hydrolase family protein [Thermohalobaculum xanthum]